MCAHACINARKKGGTRESKRKGGRRYSGRARARARGTQPTSLGADAPWPRVCHAAAAALLSSRKWCSIIIHPRARVHVTKDARRWHATPGIVLGELFRAFLRARCFFFFFFLILTGGRL